MSRGRRKRHKQRSQLPAAPQQPQQPQQPQNSQLVSAFSTRIQTTFSGPLPPPEQLQKYDEILPGMAARILQMAESQTKHRIELEKSVITSEGRKAWTGLGFGFCVALLGLGGGIWLVHMGHDWAGTGIATGPIAALVGVFVHGSATRKSERVEKEKIKQRR